MAKLKRSWQLYYYNDAKGDDLHDVSDTFGKKQKARTEAEKLILEGSYPRVEIVEHRDVVTVTRGVITEKHK